jgi:glyoxylase-like metal-dependent hydrolase (beta-lactamase superfamily II)
MVKGLGLDRCLWFTRTVLRGRVSPHPERQSRRPGAQVVCGVEGRGIGSAAAVKEIVRDVQTWSVFSDEKGYAFNGYAVSTEVGTVLIDPPNPGEAGWPTVDLFEPFAGVWLTNRNHSRAAAVFRERYGLTVWAHEADAERLEAGADRVVAGNTTIAGDIEIVPVPGKSPGEIAFHLPRSRALIVGDLVIGVPAGELSTYPDEVIDDKAELHHSAARLLDYDFDALLLCDGQPLPSGGKDRLREFVVSSDR